MAKTSAHSPAAQGKRPQQPHGTNKGARVARGPASQTQTQSPRGRAAGRNASPRGQKGRADDDEEDEDEDEDDDDKPNEDEDDDDDNEKPPEADPEQMRRINALLSQMDSRSGDAAGKKPKNQQANPPAKGKGTRKQRMQEETREIAELTARCNALPRSTDIIGARSAAAPTTNQEASDETPKKADATATTTTPSTFTRFAELPLSSRTQAALRDCAYVKLTEIQRVSLPDGLAGRDVLGAAKTGSGKTLAFLLPVVERLYRLRWSSEDGIGAIVITPTRELAFQIFEVLRKIGARHELAAGLVIGGKDVEQEKERINGMNILVCTPGRLLQHMDETPNFDCSNLQMLVLDEADRILDMGFARTLDAILDFLPRSRQTLLFSATQTKSVRDLARLSLTSPEYAAVHEHAKHSTPKGLSQSYVVTALPDKLDILYSFIRTHTSSKTLVFLSSCKQVRFVLETFRRLRPGVPLMALYGKQKQMKRMAIYSDFAKKPSAVLFATDIAARGLDFPAVHWVIQVDCPEDASTYIHRVGRTARADKSGNALLMVLPSEEKGMVATLAEKRIPIEKREINPDRSSSIRPSLAAFCTQEPELKYLAQKYFVSYMRSVFLQPNKQVFDVHALPAEEFALSLGLPGQPNIRYLKKVKKVHGPAASAAAAAEDGSEDDGSDDDDASDDDSDSDNEDKSWGAESAPKEKAKSKIDRIRLRQNQGVLSTAWQKLREQDEETGEDDLLVLKRRNHGVDGVDDDDDAPEEAKINRDGTAMDTAEEASSSKKKTLTRAKVAKKLINANIKANTKVVFDDDGLALDESGKVVEDGIVSIPDPEVIEEPRPNVPVTIEESKARMKEADRLDRLAERRRVQEKHKEKSRKAREKRQAEAAGYLEMKFGAQGNDQEEEDDEDDDDQDDENEDDDDQDEPEPVRNHGRGSKRGHEDSDGASAKQASKRARSLVDDEELALALLQG
ncbi:ATP-dependent RNA helicase dbp4 [Capsaspora owczarzaki ATCC 30864]|uniref:ATP-dependent RNA helicase n=1 Tax=Capsaspora owczarzaki (strain ATCC 30864) TaxID=595528 RepID=A0A0D2X4E6_CAPO3|nr:ATP-dependent RNA helicase dbp4 [Capsaspora owczarzaki ATCC 30864]KJE95924.1 ATP-dependent RNA helicase dbp4 [Capsaspora owczarzaki ATCC 30864]|eukprot:XP_004345065.1 ATP-dependent RNA helicase dbp4 [Capsaspora owczarzaki ATCC 30864]